MKTGVRNPIKINRIVSPNTKSPPLRLHNKADFHMSVQPVGELSKTGTKEKSMKKQANKR